MKRLLLAIACTGLLAGCFSATTVPNTQKAIEDRLTCQCGCGLTVHSCNHLQCGFAVPTREDIAKSLAAGQTADEIIARYVSKYGEKVLSSPTTRGFNLVAWYAPYVAVLIGTVGILLLLRRWIGGKLHADAAGSTATVVSDTDRKKLERELEDLES